MSTIGSDTGGIQNTFSSWDQCMAEAYCKWPVYVGIVIASLILLSLVGCLARCLCCGAELCCGCQSCLSCCCSNGRGRRQNPEYQPPPPQLYQPYPQQYQSQPPPIYGGYAQGNNYRGAQTATFDAPTMNSAVPKYNEDALPAMPSWDNATNKHVEEEPEDVEMERLSHPQQQPLLHQRGQPYSFPYASQTRTQSGDLGMMDGAGDQYYQQYQPQQSPYTTAHTPSEYDERSPHYASPTASMYSPANSFQSQGVPQQHGGYGGLRSPYEPSVAASYHTSAPSYHTNAPSMRSGQIGRKAVQGSWRDV